MEAEAGCREMAVNRFREVNPSRRRQVVACILIALNALVARMRECSESREMPVNLLNTFASAVYLGCFFDLSNVHSVRKTPGICGYVWLDLQ